MTSKFQRKLEKIKNDELYIECVKDVFNSEAVNKMNEFIQHGKITTLEHCINVSYKSFKIAKKLKLDYKSAARAGLLHDLFLYDWHLEPKGVKLFQKHGFTHPKKALENSLKYFNLNDKEKDIIEKHMWPLTLRKVPKYKESFLISIVDKYAACGETISPLLDKISGYLL